MENKIVPTQYDTFKKYAVPAASVRDFLLRYYRPERFTELCTIGVRTKSHEEDVQCDGYTFISHHDSVTGRIVAFFPDLSPQMTEAR